MCRIRQCVASQNALGTFIGSAHHKRGVKHNHACGQISEDAFQIRLGILQFTLLGLHTAARVFELAGHAIKALGKQAQFVLAAHFRARGEIAFGNGLRAFRQHFQRRGQSCREQKRRAQCGEQSQHQSERERNGVNLAQSAARQYQFLIVAIALAY